MLNIFSKFIDSNQSELNRLKKIVDVVNSLERKYQKLDGQKLREKTTEFKKALNKGQTLDEILPDAYAAVREAFNREMKIRLYDVQLMAAIALHQGKIAEQKTGEGKTFTAVAALYLNSLSGKAVHLVTVNDYLARRECGWTGPIYDALGVSCATIIHEQAFIYDPKFKDSSHTDPRLWRLKPITRQQAYNADVLVGTNNQFGFDYLKDNMVKSLSQKVQRGHHFAVVDEVDSILIDEARTPLIISAPSQEPTQKYYEFAKLINQLDPQTDFIIDEKQKTANLTEDGILKIEKILKVDNLYEKDFSTLHHVEQALKARALFTKDKEYVLKDNEIIIVDEFTGRLMPGRRYSEGLHQAIEAKEGVTIQQESQTLATISFQNYFRMYEKLAGMTGTAATEAEEFHKIYNLDVIVIPTHNPMIRQDHPDIIYKTHNAKFAAVALEVEKVHQNGQPVLVGTTSIEKNEYLSGLLLKKGINHALLNAKNHEKEAEIISKAGEKGAVTVATNMAGRGVDIKLGKGAADLGGLYVIGTERHESRRIDNQLRGRSGRQGDPGQTRFFISLEDDLMRIFGGEQVARIMNFLKIPEDSPIEHNMVSKALESAQKKVEGHNFDIRKSTLEYDDVMNQQRQVIYGIRDKILQTAQDKSQSLRDDILNKIKDEISQIVLLHSQDGIGYEKILNEFLTIINFDPNSQEELNKHLKTFSSAEALTEFLQNLAVEKYQEREDTYGLDLSKEMEVFVYLSIIDTLWIEHLDTMDDLRTGIGLRSFGQREPIVEYKKEAFEIFERLIQTIDHEVVYKIYKISPAGEAQKQNLQTIDLSNISELHDEALDEKQLKEDLGNFLSPSDPQPSKQTTSNQKTKVTIERDGQIISQQTYGNNHQLSSKKPGRNDPCWCGKKKPDGTPVKYKHCHYPN